MTTQQSRTEMVKLGDLRFGHDPECGMNINARRTDREASVDELAGMIREQGIIQSLAVCKGPKGKDRPLFVAEGNRRLAALHLIHGVKGSKAEEVEVPVIIVPRERALEMSQAAAHARLPLHPIDQFQTFAELIGPPHNLTPDDIALRFSIRDPKIIRQRLALGGLSPKIVEAWRARVIQDDAAQAFTMAKSHDDQNRVFDKLKKSRALHGHAIRQEIVGADRDVGRLVEFVGRAKYQDGGGTIIEDLFGTQHGVSDAPLLRKMADERIATERERLLRDGWKWADVETNLPESHYSWTLISYKQNHKFSAAEKAKSGCIIKIDHQGKLQVVEGYVQPADKPKPDAKKKDKGASDAPEISAALTLRMSGWLTQAAAESVTPDVALVLTIAAMTTHTAPVKIRATGIESDKLIDNKADFGKIMWRVAGRPIKQRMELLAKMVGASFNFQTHHAPSILSEGVGDIINAMPTVRFQIAMANIFKTNAADYFASIGKALLIKAINEAAPKVVVKDTMSKGDLGKIAIENCPKAGWLPWELRTSHYDGPKASAKKPATKKAAKKKN